MAFSLADSAADAVNGTNSFTAKQPVQALARIHTNYTQVIVRKSAGISDLCAMNAPEELDLHLIDPKRGVDYGWARRLPHLKSGIVADQDEARELLSRLVDEMEVDDMGAHTRTT